MLFKAPRAWGTAGWIRLVRTSTVAVGAIAVTTAFAAPANGDSFVGPTPDAMGGPEMTAANAVGLAYEAAQQAGLSTPEAVAERADSTDAYTDLSSSDASDLAAETFAPLSDPTWEPPEIPDGWDLVRYEGKTGMLIAPEGTGDQLSNPPDTIPVGTDLSNLGINGRVIESTMPIRAQDGSQGLQPVDPSLDDKGDYVEPTNAVVEAQIPDDLSDGIDLPELDVSLRPEGANGASDAEQIGTDKLFYADVATDTDFLAAPTPIGVETFLQLRSADSPEQQSLHVDVPEGGSLSATDDGGAVIDDADGPVASVLPPSATDADGTPVPVEMSVDGSSLQLEINHQDGDFHYPILVDPVTQSYDWLSWTGDACPGAGTNGNVGWWFETTAPTKFAAAGCQAGNYGMGLLNAGFSGKNYAANDYSQWLWKPPAKTSIQSVTFGYTHGQSATSCANYGIYKTQSPAGWQASNLSDPNRCSSWGTNESKTYSIGSTGVEQNLAVMGLSYPTSGKRTSNANDFAGTFAATLYDEHPPTFTSTKPDDSAWVDDTEGSSTHQYSANIEATDEGLGVKYLWFLSPQVSDPSQWAVQTAVRPCAVFGTGACYDPPNWSPNDPGDDFSYRLPEGENTVAAIAFDQAATMNTTSYQWTQRIDRSAPVIGSTGGSLVDERDNILDSSLYDLAVQAHDGSDSSAATKRSGIRRVDVFPDSSSTAIASSEQSCTEPGSGCPAEFDDTLQIDGSDLSDGAHTLHVIVTDGVGHTQSTTIMVTVRADDDQAPATMTVGTPNSSGAYTITVDSDDGGPISGPTSQYGSGVQSIQIFADGEEVANYEQQCSTGGCPMNRQLTLQSGSAAPEVYVFVYDEAGNLTLLHSGPYNKRIDRFGYSDFFKGDPGGDWSSHLAWDRNDPNDYYSSLAQQMLVTAARGGANTVRVDISWCGIVDLKTESDPPSTWDWGSSTEKGSAEWFFGIVRDYNNNRPTGWPLMHVLPHFVDSPLWARPTQVLHSGKTPAQFRAIASNDNKNGCGGGPVDGADQAWSPPQEDHMDEWSDFVAAFLKRFGPDANSSFATAGHANGIEAVEVWNEPNLDQFWGQYDTAAPHLWSGGNPGRYARLVAATYDGVGDAGMQSDVDVLAGALSPVTKVDDPDDDPVAFSAAYLHKLDTPLDAKQAAEGFSMHLYANGSKSDQRAMNVIRKQYRDLGDLYDNTPGFNNRERWITEIGFPGAPYSGYTSPSSTPAKQQARLGGAMAMLGSEPTAPYAFLVYRLWDDYPALLGSAEVPGKDEGAEFGVWKDYTEETPKAIYCILAKMAATGTGTPSECS